MARPLPHEAEFQVACAGICVLDRLLEAPRFPKPDEKLSLRAITHQAGGQAATPAVALARWGLSARYLGAVGDDEAGRICRETLSREGVDISGCVVVPDCMTQQAFVMVDPEGRRTILFHRPEGLVGVGYEAPRASWLHLDGQEIEAATRLAREARAQNVRVSLDLELPAEQCRELISLCDVVVADRPAGLSLARGPLEASRRLADMGPWFTGVTLGEDGACGWCEGQPLFAPALTVQVADTTGAGDIFHAGVVFGLLQDWSPERTWIFANAAAGLSCRVVGGMPGIASLSEIMRVVEVL